MLQQRVMLWQRLHINSRLFTIFMFMVHTKKTTEAQSQTTQNKSNTNLDKEMSHAVSRIIMLRSCVDDKDSLHHFLYLRFNADRITVV